MARKFLKRKTLKKGGEEREKTRLPPMKQQETNDRARRSFTENRVVG